ncbi:MAG: bifunctional 2-polyprenyl-6-hydroxyphenol methylase/3-demethylubiquinol 3-O-methyltransferase UbiG [Desulfosarcinaceae bacterium]|nr:bifunctional 2-polyprenyl-6-hydroxyphenol methylase/3-demethylubiquinol 3-O-methyltransferase UbiG [Desulfosarcinaceae bacterium]
MNQPHRANWDPDTLRRFGAQADRWWDPKGGVGALHDINPLRLAYMESRLGLFQRRIIDVGCGGGILSEPMARAGAVVTGIDMCEPTLEVARQHAAEANVSVTYLHRSAEEMAWESPGVFDIVVCMELIEHVPDPASLVRACAILTRPGGSVFFATVNRNWLSGLLVILAAEYLLRIVARGTHQYTQLVKPTELARWGRAAGLHLAHTTGLSYLPLIRRSRLISSTAMNYMMHFEKRES